MMSHRCEFHELFAGLLRVGVGFASFGEKVRAGPRSLMHLTNRDLSGIFEGPKWFQQIVRGCWDVVRFVRLLISRSH